MRGFLPVSKSRLEVLANFFLAIRLVLSLESVGIFRKYSSFLDIPFSALTNW